MILLIDLMIKMLWVARKMLKMYNFLFRIRMFLGKLDVALIS